MGWWPFSSTTTQENAAKLEQQRGPAPTSIIPIPPAQNASTPLPETKDAATPVQQRGSFRHSESQNQSELAKGWQSYQDVLKPMIWPHGISEWPAFGLSALFIASSPFPASILPGLPPRMARLAFGGLFATSGLAIQSGDEWNGASIATWWSASHVVLSSIYKTYRKEMAKKLNKPPPVMSSPFAWVLTSATIATGAAYGITL
ncbi:hypothetical protein M408DRAFT_333709 [Serendipita vermifera MAFF 305830]|uniref:Uncharacterized protein n=1 Tax=Serendipita vermifera MAFF 305830 TaxID=933852 RepID=A0A0C2WUA0_SERVB|nr:hypothetical protein M408DRAFT_333707 [Serendipita vermifera MAFF 305830]KIM20996.1 hypothetical protein M408DRAFT_333709 [Serendipita vermifera MAFF 305830]